MVVPTALWPARRRVYAPRRRFSSTLKLANIRCPSGTWASPASTICREVARETSAPTWAHSVRSLRPGGRIVVCGATSGDAPPAELTRVFFTQLSVAGSTMGTRDQLGRLARFCEQAAVRPVIDRVLPLARARDGFAAMLDGTLFGKIVLVP